MKKRYLFLAVALLFTLLSSRTEAFASEATPAWLIRDVERKAAWLPRDIKRLGIQGAFEQRWESLPENIQFILSSYSIPHWMIALISEDPAQQEEVYKQFLFMQSLAGPEPSSPIAARAEQLLLFAGAAEMPTPGDSRTGASLGSEGCTAAMAKYILAQLKLEFPGELASLPIAATKAQSSSQLKAILERAAQNGAPWLTIRHIPFSQLRAEDIQPGSLMIAQKPGGAHSFGWTRVASGWGWSPGDKMAVGNTGLAQFGNRMILAQEYVTDSPYSPEEASHNQHGPINSQNVIYRGGAPLLSDPRTNVYAAEGSNFLLINFN